MTGTSPRMAMIAVACLSITRSRMPESLVFVETSLWPPLRIMPEVCQGFLAPRASRSHHPERMVYEHVSSHSGFMTTRFPHRVRG